MIILKICEINKTLHVLSIQLIDQMRNWKDYLLTQ